MLKAASGWTGRLRLGFLVIFTAISLRADQPPEILSASSPQTYTINGSGGQESGITAYASVCDAVGNTFVTGFFSGRATFGTNVLTGSGGYGSDDVYLVKYDPAGNVLWARRAGGTSWEIGRVLALDGAGGVYLAGLTTSSPSTFGTNVLYVAYQSLFLARYDGSGNCIWAKKAGSYVSPGIGYVVSAVTVNGLAVDPAGNLVVGGSFTGNPKFGGVITNQSFPYTLDGGIILSNRNSAGAPADLFIAKYAADGGLLWATNHGGTNAEYTSGLAVDSTGAIYLAGGFKKSTVIGGQTYTNQDDGLLLAKFSSAGDSVWTSMLRDADTNVNSGFGWSVVVDSADRVAFGFEAKTLAPFRFAGVAITNRLTGPGFTPVHMGLVAQFDSAGTLQWLKRTPFNGYGNTVPANASSLAVDAGNNLYFGSGSVPMVNETIFGLVSSAGMGILKYNSSGTGIWTNLVPQGSLTSIQPPSLCLDGSGIIRGSTTVKGDYSSLLAIGWINYYPFTAYGYNQLLFTMASNFVAVVPQFFQQPTNMVYQPPQGLTNSAQARAWPVAKYYWYMNGVKIASQTNYTFALAPTAFSNQTSYFVVASNSYGMATSVVVTAQARLAFAPLPPTNVYVLVNTTLAISAGATGTSDIAYQWQFKGTNILGANSPTLALSKIATNQAGNYTLVISNATGVLTSAPPSVVTVLPVGSVDPSWTNQFASYIGGVNGLTRAPDGSYYAVNGVNAVHVGADGSLDTNGFINILSYYYRWNNSSPSDLYLGPLLVVRETSGKLILGGTFKAFYPTPVTVTNVNRLVRMNTNGTLDGTFNVGQGATNSLDGQNFSKIECVIPLANGQYLAAGTFNRFNGVAVTNLVRLNNDGSLDGTFPGHTCKYTAAGNSIGYIHTIALQADGKILVGGEFEVFDGVPNHNLTRLKADGTLDGSFVQTDLPAPSYGRVRTVLPLADGNILVGGAWNNQTNVGVLRFSTNGVRDASWSGVMPGETYAILLLPNNKLILTGNGFVRRTTYDGATDGAFNPGTSFSGQQVYTVVPEPNGNLMVGGSPFGMRRLLLEPTIVVPTFASGAGGAVVNGQFQLSACGGVEGQVIVVQASVDLLNWTNVSTNVVSGGCISFQDPQTPPLPSRYYRLAVLP